MVTPLFFRPVSASTPATVRFSGNASPPGKPEKETKSAAPAKKSTRPGRVQMHTTHSVKNVTPSLVNYNLLDVDRPLQEALTREGAPWAKGQVRRFASTLGREETIRLGFEANENPPRLKTHSATGQRIDEVTFHPAYHELMKLAKKWQVHSLSWTEKRPGAHAARAAMFYLLTQVEAGHCCPITMTHAGIAVLKQHPEIPQKWVQAMLNNAYDPRPLPVDQKTGTTMGMGMTEKQGGSDVRANTTWASPVRKGGPGKAYNIIGHKWFFSAPMSDSLLTLAQTEQGLSCFFVPRWLDDGKVNRIHLQRLKDKLGNRSNASSEIEYFKARGYLVGEEGRGVRTIMDMVNFTRLDCVVGSAGLMRQALTQAIHHAQNRETFGKKLIDHPLMQNVLADLAVESEAATTLGMRLARAFDEAKENEQAEKLARIATAVSKYWVCKRAPNTIYEAMESLGGNGYVEESILPRLYREAPVNSIWEGSGNIICLDVLRAMQRDPETVKVYFDEVETARGKDPRFDQFVDGLKQELTQPADMEVRARRVVDKMALALQGSLLLRHAPKAVADAFCASRLTPEAAYNFGTLPPDTDFQAILKRAFPRG